MKLEQDLQLILKLNLSDQANQHGFEWFTRYIIKKEVRQASSNFLANFKLQLNAREFLSSYVLANFPDLALASERNDLEEEVYQCALNLIGSVSETSFSPDKFIGLSQTYYECFNRWKNQDKEDLIKILAKTHKQVKTFSDSLPAGEGEGGQEISQTLNKLEKIAKQLGGEKAEAQVKQSTETGLIDPEVLATQIAGQMTQGFWDIFTQELSESPPNFRQYPDLILEIKTRLCLILPKQKQQETQKYITENLDETLVKQKITNDSYTLQDIYNLCIFCLERLKELGSPEDENTVQFYIDMVHQKMTEETVKIHEIIPNTFKVVLEKLDHIIQVHR